jgi:hypothetical protein
MQKRIVSMILSLSVLGCASPAKVFDACGKICPAGVDSVSAERDAARCRCVEAPR